MSAAGRAEDPEIGVGFVCQYLGSHGARPLTIHSGNRFKNIEESRRIPGVSQLSLDETLLSWEEVLFPFISCTI